MDWFDTDGNIAQKDRPQAEQGVAGRRNGARLLKRADRVASRRHFLTGAYSCILIATSSWLSPK